MHDQFHNTSHAHIFFFFIFYHFFYDGMNILSNNDLKKDWALFIEMTLLTKILYINVYEMKCKWWYVQSSYNEMWKIITQYMRRNKMNQIIWKRWNKEH